MKRYQRILLFFLFVLFLTSLLSPWVARFWDWFLVHHAGWGEFRYSFSRIFDRLFMILGIVLFFPFRHFLHFQSARDFGLTPVKNEAHELWRGFFLSLASVVVLLFAMAAADVFQPYFRLSLAESVERSVKAFLAGATVGFLEEIFFRGIILKGLLEHWRTIPAFIAANLFYSAVHFVKPAEKIPLDAAQPWTGFRHVFLSFSSFLEPGELLPGFIGLFLIGLVLSYSFLRTGSLYLCMGLHAGWIFAFKSIRVYGDYRREDLGLLFGSAHPKIITGAATWVGVLAVGIAVHWLTRKRSPFMANASGR